MGGVGIYEVNELEGDLRKRINRFREWLIEEIPQEVLKNHCELHGKKLQWDEAAKGHMKWLYQEKAHAEKLTEEKQARIDELVAFIRDGLIELPVELFNRGKLLLGLGPDEGPARPFTADDSFRDAMSHAAESIERANLSDRAGLYIAMMDAIARKQAAEATEKAAAAAVQTGVELLKNQENILKEEFGRKTAAKDL